MIEITVNWLPDKSNPIATSRFRDVADSIAQGLLERFFGGRNAHMHAGKEEATVELREDGELVGIWKWDEKTEPTYGPVEETIQRGDS